MKMFWQLLKESVIVQAIVTLACVGTLLYLYIEQKNVPEYLLVLTNLIVGFWFGSKSQQAINKLG